MIGCVLMAVAWHGLAFWQNSSWALHITKPLNYIIMQWIRSKKTLKRYRTKKGKPWDRLQNPHKRIQKTQHMLAPQRQMVSFDARTLAISCNYVRLHHSKRSQGRIALLHLDADLYSSYLDTLFNLYDLLEIGSFVICDDCGYIEEAGRAVTDFRILHGIDALQQLSDSELTRYWQKTAEVEIDWSPLLTWLHCFSFDTRFGQSHRSINLLWLWVAVIAHFFDLDVFWAT